MRNRYRSASISGWAFWMTLLVGGTFYGAYRFDWFPLAFLPFANASRAAVAANEPAPAETPAIPPGGQIEVAQTAVEGQSEPDPSESEKIALADKGAQTARARLLEQRAEGLRPTQRANAGTLATVEPTSINDLPAKRPPFEETRPVEKPRTSAENVVPIAHTVVEPDPVDPKLVARLKTVDRQLAVGDVLAAHRELSTLYWAQPQCRPAIADRITKTAQTIYFEPQPHFLDSYVVKPNDQLGPIAKRFDVPWEYLAKLNRVDPKKIRGQELKVIKGPFSAIVELADFRLTVHSYGYYVKAYKIGIGKDGSSPLGKHTVLSKMVNPQYTDPQGHVVQGDDPANPIGERWLDLGGGYGIHGTIEPDSIGKAESHGCIRLRNEDVEEVYDLLAVGSDVTIRP